MAVAEISFPARRRDSLWDYNCISLKSVFKQLLKSQCLAAELSDKHSPMLAVQ